MQSIQWSLAFVAAATLTACGGGGSGSSSAAATSQGTFLDSAVSGLGYTCGSTSGTTDSAGHFNYESGSTCTFKIGGVTIGSAAAASTLTPVSLVSGASDETHPQVSNIARFLQSLDSDNNPGNGITIDSNVATTLSSDTLDFSSSSFGTSAQTLVTKAISTRTLVSDSTAQAHMRDSILLKLAGAYSCTYTGNDHGTAAITLGVLAGGGTTISGTAHSNESNVNYTITGSYMSSGSSSFAAGGSSSGATFSGSMAIVGSGSGTWVNGSYAGTWNCTKSS